MHNKVHQLTIQAVFWDYDNTILVTADAHWRKHERILAKHGIELNPIYKKRIYENNGSQNWKWMREELNLKIPEDAYLEMIDREFQKRSTQPRNAFGCA